MNSSPTKKPKKRIFYFDALRALAIISVILFHVNMQCSPLIVKQFALFPSFEWWVTDVLASCFRIGVDVFLMLSGALSLGRVWDIKSFLSKRLPRILFPFLFWGMVLSIFMVVLSFLYPDPVHPTVSSFNLTEFLHYLYNSFMSKNPGFTQYWFFWMILGTYLIMPVFNKWLLHADLREAEYFLAIWVVACLFESTLMIHCPVNLVYFTGPIGMVVLGYYLRHTERKIFNNIYYSLLFLIIGSISLIALSYLASDVTKIAYIDRYSVFTIIEVIGVFTLFKNLSNLNLKFPDPGNIFHKGIFSIAKYSYGIYLVHRVAIVLLYRGLKLQLSYMELLAVTAVGSLVISWLLLAILNRVPYVNTVIGAK